MVRTYLCALSLLVVAASCSSPPLPPSAPLAPEPTGAPIAVAVDASALRPMADRQRARLRDLIDLAEQRELRESGPRMLRAAKEQSRELDRIEARIDDAMRNGSSDGEVDEIHEQLRRFGARLDLLADTLR